MRLEARFALVFFVKVEGVGLLRVFTPCVLESKWFSGERALLVVLDAFYELVASLRLGYRLDEDLLLVPSADVGKLKPKAYFAHLVATAKPKPMGGSSRLVPPAIELLWLN